MPRTDTLTTNEVAALAGIDRSHVPAWCADRGIFRVSVGTERPYLYPGVAVRDAVTVPEPLRLRRWVMKALIA